MTPPVTAERVAVLSQLMRGWRISPNGRYLFFPSDSDEPDSIGQLEKACAALSSIGIAVDGSGTWTGEDDSRGTIQVCNSVVEHHQTEPPDEAT